MEEKRGREWLEKPVFHGVPLSSAQAYCQKRLSQFRSEHPEFDMFLNELNKLLKEGSHRFPNIEKFIGGEAEVNWIAPKDVLFDALVGLFNYCFSPQQAYRYICSCHRLYLEMIAMDYELFGRREVSIREDHWDGKPAKFLRVSLRPVVREKEEQLFHFAITTSLTVIEDHGQMDSHVDKIELRGALPRQEDALRLFENGQNGGLKEKVFETALRVLETEGTIREGGKEIRHGWIIHRYETDLAIEWKGKEDIKTI